MLCYVMLCYVMLCCVVLCCVVLCCVVLCCVVLGCVVLCYVILYYNNLMVPPSYMRSVVDRKFVMRRIPVHFHEIIISGCPRYADQPST